MSCPTWKVACFQVASNQEGPMFPGCIWPGRSYVSRLNLTGTVPCFQVVFNQEGPVFPGCIWPGRSHVSRLYLTRKVPCFQVVSNPEGPMFWGCITKKGNISRSCVTRKLVCVQVLRFIGETSPECLLQLGCPLNIPAPLPEALSAPAEMDVTGMVQHQTEMELHYYSKHKADCRWEGCSLPFRSFWLSVALWIVSKEELWVKETSISFKTRYAQHRK